MKHIEYIVYTDKTMGSMNLRNVCRYMKDHNFKNIEIIDLNTIEHLNERELEKNNIYKINVEIGVEIITNIEGMSIVALGVDKVKYKIIENYIAKKEKSNIDFYKTIIQNLRKMFSINLDEREILLYGNKSFINLVDIARLLYKKGYAPNVRMAFTNYIDKCRKIEDGETYNDVLETINILKRVSNEVYFYNYAKSKKNKKLEDKLGIKELKIRIFENHQTDNIVY